ncbi:MAG: GNAT family N-acetyltransferase [Vicinamibacteria bacterium]|jgi:GNAT superfamily N-acetyltransferase|nr:GNAT family N-acetyltransferase [Vicinamibacteria bacterium]
MSERTRIVALDDPQTPEFQQALKLFTRVFPAAERIDRRYFDDVMAEKRLGLMFPFNTYFFVALRRDQVIGFCSGTYMAVVNMGFVGYLAVDPAMKGAQIGSRLRRRLVEAMRKDARANGCTDLAGVAGEVETDNPWLRHLVERKGALALDFDYRQPALRPGTREVPLTLYIEPASRHTPRSLPTWQVKALVYALYRRLYRVRFPLRLASFRRMLRALDGRRRIGQRPLPPPRRYGAKRE